MLNLQGLIAIQGGVAVKMVMKKKVYDMKINKTGSENKEESMINP